MRRPFQGRASGTNFKRLRGLATANLWQVLVGDFAGAGPGKCAAGIGGLECRGFCSERRRYRSGLLECYGDYAATALGVGGSGHGRRLDIFTLVAAGGKDGTFSRLV